MSMKLYEPQNHFSTTNMSIQLDYNNICPQKCKLQKCKLQKCKLHLHNTYKLVCIVILTVLPHLICYLLSEINHKRMFSSLPTRCCSMVMNWPIGFFNNQMITPILYNPIMNNATCYNNVYLSMKWEEWCCIIKNFEPPLE